MPVRFSLLVIMVGLALAVAGCVTPTALLPEEGGRMERLGSGEQSVEEYRPGGYHLAIDREGQRLRMWQDSGPGSRHRAEAADFLADIDHLAARIEAMMAARGGAGNQVVLLPTTFVNLDDLTKSSTFGRLCAEELSVALMKRRFDVVELRRTIDLRLRPKSGELALSRESRELSRSYRANALLVGTYTVTAQHVVLSARLVRTGDNKLASAGTAVFDRAGNLFLNSLLLSEQAALTHEQASAPQPGRMVKIGVSTRYTGRSAIKEENIGPAPQPAAAQPKVKKK